MIRKPVGVTNMHFDLMQRVELTHFTCQRIVRDLRDEKAEIWSGAPPKDAANAFSAGGWLQHFTSERARLGVLHEKVSGIVSRQYPEMAQPIADYLDDTPLIAADIAAVLKNHSENELLSMDERLALADAIEARCEQ